jgi:arginyl-tRNA synthetase
MDFDKEIFDKVSDSHIIYFFFVRSKRKSKISFDLKPAVSFGGSTIDFVAKKERKRNGIKIQIQG